MTTQSLRFFIDKRDQDENIDSAYEYFVNIIDEISGVDPALKDWYTPLMSKKTEEYCSVREREKVVTDARLQTRKYREDYSGTGQVSFNALSQKIGIGGSSDEDKNSLAKITFFSGSSSQSGAIGIDVRKMKEGGVDTYWLKIAEMVKRVSQIEKPLWANVAPIKYQKLSAFPHRKKVGWMVMVPDVDLTSKIDFIPYSEYIPGIGTFIVTTKEPFSEKNAEHVELGRAVEIFLADRGLLPEF